MIVRVLGEGQYRLDDSHHAKLDELDDLVVARVDADDEKGYTTAFSELLSFVRDTGNPLEEDELMGSDFMLPPADLSFEEAGQEFTGEGLIPDQPA
ncbi:MAG: hypothetical protein H0V81_14450 [Solirubrobacterales bacterium]|nr:hypothetical protein [Solirubrobacterales bacterium]